MGPGESFFHVGVVVPDLEAAQAHLSELLGITWGPIGELDIAKRDAAGNDLTLPLRMCYSVEAPRLELIQELAGSVWECNEHSNLHHIGVWTDALPADSATYSELRCPLQLCGHDGATAPTQFAYHRDPLGVRIELVDVAMKPMMEEFMFKAPVA